MNFIDELTVMILTFNEACNITRTLEAVKWAKHILILDSGSTDETLAIVARYPQVTVVSRNFDSFAGQCNFGLTQVGTKWVLSMDADYIVSKQLAREIQALEPAADVAGFMARFVYVIHGTMLRATLYPPRCVLYRRESAGYHDEGHGHRVRINGKIRWLTGTISHDDRKPLQRWLNSQQNYARLEADYLLSAKPAGLRRTQRLRRMGWPAPIVVFLYTLILKRCILDGRAGWIYVLQRTLAETMIAIELLDRRLRGLRKI